MTLVGVIAAGMPAAAANGPSERGPTYKRNRGQIVFSAQPLQTPATEKEFGELIRKARQQKTLPQDKTGRWEFHFIAFLRQAPGADKVNLVWYRGAGKRPEQVDYVEFTVPPSGVTLRSKATLSPAQFNPGDQIEARITRLIGGRERVYATCRLTLAK